MTLKGMLTGVFIADDPDSIVSKRVGVLEAARISPCGLEGDKHEGWFRKADARAKRYPKGTRIWNSRQLSIVSEEELVLIAQELGVPEVKPQWLGANMCLRGIPDVSLLPPRTKIFMPNHNREAPEVGIYVTAPNKPCINPGEIIQSQHLDIPGLAARFVSAALNRRGVVAVVEHCGLIRSGDPISVVIQ